MPEGGIFCALAGTNSYVLKYVDYVYNASRALGGVTRTSKYFLLT